MKLLDNYLEARKEICNYFRILDWCIPFHDERTYFWDVDKESDSLMYAVTEVCFFEECGDYYYESELIEFHEGADYSLAIVRSDFGGDDVGIIFSNDKRRKAKT